MSDGSAPEPRFFESQDEFRRWLDKNHAKRDSLWVGLNRRASGLGGINYKQALDTALCFGWIDGLVKGIDERRYMIRFSPRKSNSLWSAVNIKRFGELQEAGLVHPAGVAAFERRDPSRKEQYSYENPEKALDPRLDALFRKNRKAWSFFQREPQGVRRTAIFFVMSAKRETTREKRLQLLIKRSEEGLRLPQFLSAKKRAADH